MPHGLVSVITPARNSSAVIERAIASVAAQTARVLEHIIIDDGSDDATAEVIAGLSRRHPHIVYIHQPWKGAAHARNLGIELARGRYIAFLDSDDCWLERKVELQIGFMERTGATFSYGDYRVCDPGTGRVIRERRPPQAVHYRDLMERCPIGCLTAAYNQERLGKVYMPLVKRGQDWGLWLALTRSGAPGLKYPGSEAVYYARSGSLSRNKFLKCLDVYRIYREHERQSRLRAMRHLASFACASVWGNLRRT